VLAVAVIGVTLILVIRTDAPLATKVIIAVLGASGSILSNFVAAIYLKMNTAATENLGKSFEIGRNTQIATWQPACFTN
jgi:hypothetical protein